MRKNPLFSTYRQGENRVTSSMLAVFERIDLSLLEAILAAATGEASIQLVSFVNQPHGKGASVPDARISANFAYWFEVKTARDMVDTTQLEEHLKNLGAATANQQLCVVTPDISEPPSIAALGDSRVVWFNFRAVSDAIDAVLADPLGLIADRARFLLRELQALLIEDGLVETEEVVVVAARFGYPEYLRYGAYICQPDRSFRSGVTHMAFYAKAAIQPEVAKTVRRIDSIPFTIVEADRRRRSGGTDEIVGDLIESVLKDGARTAGNEHGGFVLSPSDDPATLTLPNPIENDTVTESGRRWAWTMGQRYVSLAQLTRPGITKTSHLVDP